MKYELDYSEKKYQLNPEFESRFKAEIDKEIKKVEKDYLFRGEDILKWSMLDVFLIVDNFIIPTNDPTESIPLTALSRNSKDKTTLFIPNWLILK